MAKEICIRLSMSNSTASILHELGLSEEQIDKVEEALANIAVTVDADTGKILEFHQDEHFSFN